MEGAACTWDADSGINYGNTFLCCAFFLQAYRRRHYVCGK